MKAKSLTATQKPQVLRVPEDKETKGPSLKSHTERKLVFLSRKWKRAFFQICVISIRINSPLLEV